VVARQWWQDSGGKTGGGKTVSVRQVMAIQVVARQWWQDSGGKTGGGKTVVALQCWQDR